MTACGFSNIVAIVVNNRSNVCSRARVCVNLLTQLSKYCYFITYKTSTETPLPRERPHCCRVRGPVGCIYRLTRKHVLEPQQLRGHKFIGDGYCFCSEEFRVFPTYAHALALEGWFLRKRENNFS